MYASQSTIEHCITIYLSLDLQWLWKHGPFFWLHHQALSACYWIFRCRSDFLKTSFLTNRHLLLPGTIFGHTKLISCFWSAALLVIGECITSVFSMELQCLHSLHPVASPTLLASPRMCLLLMTKLMLGTWLYTQYTYFSVMGIFIPWPHAAQVLLYNSCNNSHTGSSCIERILSHICTVDCYTL